MTDAEQHPVLTHLLYLHGFRSSPQSAKARQTQEWFALNHPDVWVQVPAIPPSPREAAQLIQGIVNNWPQQSLAVMGSSLGGYYASWVAAQCGCPAVLLNPAVEPARDLAAYIGETTHWHEPQEAFYFREHYIEELRELDSRCAALRAPQLALIARGDEVLSWREMCDRYADATQIVLEGGDHALSSDFLPHLPQLGGFLYRLGRPEAAQMQPAPPTS